MTQRSNSRKKRFVNPIRKSPAIFKVHQPPRALYPYMPDAWYLTKYAWGILDICLRYAWIMPYISFRFTCNLMESCWYKPGIYLRYAWDISEIYLKYKDLVWILTYTQHLAVKLGLVEIYLRDTWNMPESCLIFDWNMPDIYHTYTEDMSEIYQAYVYDVLELCLSCFWYLPQIWLRYTRYVPEIYLICAQDMSEIC